MLPLSLMGTFGGSSSLHEFTTRNFFMQAMLFLRLAATDGPSASASQQCPFISGTTLVGRILLKITPHMGDYKYFSVSVLPFEKALKIYVTFTGPMIAWTQKGGYVPFQSTSWEHGPWRLCQCGRVVKSRAFATTPTQV